MSDNQDWDNCKGCKNSQFEEYRCEVTPWAICRNFGCVTIW